ncbi:MULTISPECIES: glucose 1-dehydrogenase [unclassified Sphingopyxis]|uniref:SDR family NAD(P)-dependent oxidoreductase n=1 Tax=unclassified Sphingopyxis TaxID=2614943 RepID=UPI00072FF470|nr:MULTISPECIES: glucose 1-dehydrogenase [unclassified Sphingopyxis]KTE25065.1 short-chain dehydrogenase [Sphingopyxis sp. H057]KTE53634.1 short-chain dehydrogenase [Sphingopyxis sp. H073]KTE56227.1 short-chain dehydrogenase [Sphingopyxis sp. H071]KTE61920.1 short-chain dehydrogenase [Sphingopyxis sp. H107]KTE67193.1 short-chain dehydrogenase [Sphingopyxis sp. H100]
MTDRARLDGQAAFVTGGGGGIGRAIALRLAEAGADVAIFDIFPERAEEAAERVREHGRQALPIAGDVMDSDALRAGVDAAAAEFGRLDILINNAGGVSARPFLEQSERSMRKHIDINLMSMLIATQAAAKHMVDGGRGGAIVNVASIEASRAAPNFAVYAACKAGMLSFTKSMAVELSGHGIRVNCIAPDHTITPGNQGNRAGPVDPATWKQRSDDDIDAMNRLIPLGREGVDTECGDAAVFLASAMSAYVTGILLPVDGGTWASSGWVRGRDRRWTLNEGLAFGA